MSCKVVAKSPYPVSNLECSFDKYIMCLPTGKSICYLSSHSLKVGDLLEQSKENECGTDTAGFKAQLQTELTVPQARHLEDLETWWLHHGNM